MKLLQASIITIMFLLVACVKEDVPRNEGVSVGDPLPRFEVMLNNGKTVSTATLQGEVGVIIFFSTSCGDCQRELPNLETVYRYFEENGSVEMLAISREENPENVERFWQENELTIPYSVQTDRRVYNLFATVGVPRVYITDKHNIIVSAFDDSDIPSPEQLIEIIDEILQNN
ncbi:MAG: TlpA family protein disulfide reductase [Bacteroides sp.]|nr:TlpA family protein disulfide reductase [Bacteroides sp.]